MSLVICMSFLINGCSTPDKNDKKVPVPLLDENIVEARINTLEQLRTERDVYLRLMGTAGTVEELDKYKKELDSITTQINRLEIEVPKDVPKPKDVEVEVTLAESEIIKAKKDRIDELKQQRDVLNKMLAKSATEKEVETIKNELNGLQGNIEDLEEEVRTQELEDVAQQQFAAKNGTVYGPLGIACKSLEILFKRLFILFEY